jgi:hypothetical protein
MFQELFSSADFDINGNELCINVELINYFSNSCGS